jgi:hypothetical protein
MNSDSKKKNIYIYIKICPNMGGNQDLISLAQ